VPSTSITARVGLPPTTTRAPPARQSGRAAAAGVETPDPLIAWGPPPAGLAWSDVAGIPDLASGPRRVGALALCLVLLGVSLIVALSLSTATGLLPVAPVWGRIAPLIHQALPGSDAAGPGAPADPVSGMVAPATGLVP
jgi:hypothetical protein